MVATVTVESSSLNPRETWNGDQGLPSSSSPKQTPCLAREPIHPWSRRPGRCSKTLIIMSRTARPMVELARLPGLSMSLVQFSPILCRMGPLTMMPSVAQLVVQEAWWTQLGSYWKRTSSVARTTGK